MADIGQTLVRSSYSGRVGLSHIRVAREDLFLAQGYLRSLWVWLHDHDLSSQLEKFTSAVTKSLRFHWCSLVTQSHTVGFLYCLP